MHSLSYVNRGWINFNDQASEGSWVWSDGSPVTYTNWLSGQPDNSGNEDCGQIHTQANGWKWGDWRCGMGTSHLICGLR